MITKKPITLKALDEAPLGTIHPINMWEDNNGFDFTMMVEEHTHYLYRSIFRAEKQDSTAVCMVFDLGGVPSIGMFSLPHSYILDNCKDYLWVNETPEIDIPKFHFPELFDY